MNLINLTPHDINVVGLDGKVTIPKSGKIARCSTKTMASKNIEFEDVTIPVYATTIGSVEGLLDEEDGTMFIVSRMVLDAAKDRADLLAPGELVRDEKGNPIGCKGLTR